MVIKLHVRNFAKLMELSDPFFVPAGFRTLFELNFLQFFQESCKGESHFCESKLYFIKVQRGVIKLYTKND